MALRSIGATPGQAIHGDGSYRPFAVLEVVRVKALQLPFSSQSSDDGVAGCRRVTNAASRCMNSCGDVTKCMVPSRQAVFSLSTNVPTAFFRTRSLATAGRVM